MSEECRVCEAERAKGDWDYGCFHSVEERLGLESVECFCDPNASYSFDYFCVWRRKSDGSLFYGQDSGCSCPSPFENVNKIEDLYAITPNSWSEFKNALSAFCSQKSEPYNEEYTEKIGPRWVEAHVEAACVDKVRAMLYANIAVGEVPTNG